MDKFTPFPHQPGGAQPLHPATSRSAAAASGHPPPPRRLHSTDLFDGEQQIEIAHGDAVYRLRRTALGKLILTK